MKRFLSFCLAVVMIFSCLPVFSVQATAEDPVLPAQTQPIEVPDPTTETVPEEPLPEETIPGETSPEEAVPEEVPAETAVPTDPPETTEPVGGSTPAQVISVEWTAPHKCEYIQNRESLDTTGCTLTLIYDDGSQKVYNISPKHVTGFDNTILGTQTLVATCQGYELYFDVVVKMLEPQSMFFREWEVKRAYFLGEDLDLTGGTLQVYYSDGSVVMVPVEDPGVAVSGYDPNLLGEQFLTISYQGLTTEFRVTVCSYTGKCGDNLDYVFDEATGTLTITGTGAMYDSTPWTAYAEQIRTVELPETLTALGKSAFWCCYNLNSINLPDGITSIPDGALEECRALTSLEIPDSVTHIGHYAFSGAGLTGLDLPEGLESIGNYAFMSCGSLREIVLPESLKSLGGGAFYYCQNLETANIPETLNSISWYTFNECTSLQEITIPKSVTEISYWAFNSCTALNSVSFEGSAPNVDSGLFGNCYPFDNVTSDAWYPESETSWTQSAMQSMGGNLTWNALPASASILTFHDELAGQIATTAVSDGMTIMEAPVPPQNSYYTFLGWFSGRDGKGEQLIPGETVWYEGMPLDYYACYMENDLDAFRNLSVYIRYYVNGIQKNTVMYTMEYMQPENMYRWLSDNTDAIRAAIPELAGSDAYYWDGKYYDYDTDELITSADLTDGDDKRVYVKAFANNVAEADVMLYVHRDIETDVSGIYAMPGYIVGESVRMYEVRDVIDANYTGSYTDIQGMYTEDSWEELLNGTDNGGVSSIRIPDDTVTKIHVILKKAPQNGICGDNLTWAFDEDSGTLSISGSGAMYDYDWEGAPWKPYADRILKVKLPDTLTVLGAFAFDGCVNLTELNLPEGIPAIPKGALNNCESLTGLTIPDSVKTIGDTALSGCHGLTELILPDSVETIENFAFSWSTGLNSVVLPKSLKTLSDGAFEGCTNLENVNIPESISIINWNTFGNCTNLKTITIPKSVTEIVYAAFGGAGLETVTFKGSAPYVAPHVFTPFDGVTADAWYPGGDATWTKDAMDSMGGNLTWKEIGGSVEPVNPELPVTATVKLRVNIRKEPSTYSVKIGVLEAGTQVTIYEIKTVDDLEWARIDQGWVVMQYLEISDSEEVTSGTCGDNLTWEFDAGTGTLTISGSGAMYDYTPDEDNAAPWYHLRKDIKNLVLSDDITTIGDCAFWGGAGMRTVHIPEGVVSIGNFAFDICEDLVEITLPETLTHIGEYAFNYCTSLKNITIPSGIAVIEYGTFYFCQSLEEVIFCGDAPTFMVYNQNGNEENIFSGVTATAIYPANDVTWTDAVKQNYGGNLTWKPMLSSLELSRYPIPLIIGRGFRVMPRMTPSNAAANLTYTVSGNAELKTSNGNWFIHGTAPGTATITVTDSITGLTAELTVPVVRATAITCPYVSAPFDLSEVECPVFTFTPTETKQYSLTLENVDNFVKGPDAKCMIDVVDTGKNIDVTNDHYFWEETTSQVFITLEAGVTYRITPRAGDDRVQKNIVLRISEVADITGIEIPEDTMTCWFDPDAQINPFSVDAFFRPVQAIEEIIWTTSDPEIMSIRGNYSNWGEFLAHKCGTVVITANCGEYSDSVTVTVKEIPEIKLNTPVQSACNQGNEYRFTAAETGWYRFKLTVDANVYLYANKYGFSDENGEIIAHMEAGEYVVLSVNPYERQCDAEYTLLVEKLNIPTGLTLEPCLSDDGYVEVQAVFAPDNAIDQFDTVEWDNYDVVQASSANRTSARARIIGMGEVTVTVETELGLMASCSLAVGSCGRDLYWMFDKASGKLTIAGSGAMYDYNWEGAPWALYAEDILQVELPDTLAALGAYAFNGCVNLKELHLPEGIPAIPDFALNQCTALTSLTIPDSVKVIGDTAISDCNSLTKLILPEGLEIVEGFAFSWNTGLKEIQLPQSLTNLGGNVFNNCIALETVNIPESLSVINWGTFYDCTSLKEITIPKSVTEIGYHAFIGCTALETITFAGSAPQPAYGNDDPHFAPFRDLTADAWYPAEDPSWTDETMQRLGRDLNWIPIGTPKNCIIVDSADLGGAETAWVDGVEYPISYRSGSGYIFLPDNTAKTMVVHSYHVDDPNDIHTQYPVSMKVWTLSNEDGVYTAARQEMLDDILQYSGMSIRVYGRKGIRMITSMDQSKKNALTGGGLAGYKLKEYGTAVAWADQLSDSRPLVLGKSYVKSNYAYRRGVADPVFQYTGNLMQYTNVLVNFSNEQCRDDIAMRPYMILENAQGETVTVYGGIVYRSIGYIAYQNRNTFEPGTEEYEYVWEIIHYVYGSLYDDEYIIAWTPPIM